MMMSSNSHIHDIMLRYLNGECSAQETETFLHWISESKDNEAEFELVKRLWADTIGASTRYVDVEKAWQNVYAQTIKRDLKIISLPLWKKAIAIAASVIMIISAYYFFNQPAQTVWSETLAQNSNRQIQLPDETVITLRKGTKLSVSNDFGKKSRQVKLDGEAYFEIKHDAQNPFIIATSKSVIQDIGTAFLVQSYDSVEQVTVLEGEVSFASKKNNKKTIKLLAGESAVLEKEMPQRRSVATTNLLSWKTNTLSFSNLPLAQVAKDLENYYLINVDMPDSFGAIQITAQFRNEPLDQVIKELQLLTGLSFRMAGNTLLISKR